MGTVNATRLTSDIFTKTGNLHWRARFAAGINEPSSLAKNLVLPVQRQDAIAGGSVPLEVTSLGSLDLQEMLLNPLAIGFPLLYLEIRF